MKILYVFLKPSSVLYDMILKNELPKNFLNGYFELKNRNYNVDIIDVMPIGKFKDILYKINSKFNLVLIEFNKLFSIRKYDVVICKGFVSTMITLYCIFYKKKIILIDPILRRPKSKVRNYIYRFNLKRASKIIMYSNYQINDTVNFYNINLRKFEKIPFCLDKEFYKVRM